MRRSRWVIAGAVGAVLAGCDVVAPGPQRLRVDLEVTPTVLMAGEVPEITVIMRNVGRRRITIEGSSSCPPFGYQLLDKDEELIDDSTVYTGVCTLDLNSWTIDVGRSFSKTWQWTAAYRDSLPPGHYQLRGIVRLPGVPVYSAPVTLELREN